MYVLHLLEGWLLAADVNIDETHTFADFLITKERDNQAHEDTFKPASLRKQWDSTDNSSRLAGHSLVRKQQQTAFNQATGDFSHTACDINGPGGTNSLDCVDEFYEARK